MHFLDPDSKIFQVLSFVADLFILSALFFISCIPIITIGASATALYQVFRKKDDFKSSLVLRFIYAFRQNFRPATICWMIQLFITVFLLVDLSLLHYMNTSLAHFLVFVCLVLLLLSVSVGAMVYPQIARYQSTVRKYWKNALLISFGSSIRGIANLICFFLPEIILLLWPKAYFYCLLLRVFPGLGLQFYLSSLLMDKIFLPLEEDTPDKV